MLAIEQAAGVRATYNVVGSILSEVQDELAGGRHCVAFHSFDHSTDPESDDQLGRCRRVDYRIKGYRPPKSLITKELSDQKLAFHNFEWLASSQRSLDTDAPTMSGRLVRLPIALDDWPLYRGQLTYEQWERLLLTVIRERPFTAVSLHDCYARWWLDRYPSLLDRLADRARLCTMDEVSAEVVLSHAA
jgi:hypothetical protein